MSRKKLDIPTLKSNTRIQSILLENKVLFFIIEYLFKVLRADRVSDVWSVCIYFQASFSSNTVSILGEYLQDYFGNFLSNRVRHMLKSY